MRLLLLVAALCVTAPASAADARPNILWINAEDMSPHLGCYGHPDADTPRIDKLAESGVVYEQAFATAPICSPSRSCLATGLYATALGTQHLRCEVDIPAEIVPLAVRMRNAGYFCTNTGKSDYNFDPEGIWDVWNDDLAPWAKRPDGKPFFAFVTIGETHEGRINSREKYADAVKNLPPERLHDPERVTLPPFYPDTPEIRRIFAGMYDLATVFDNKVGTILDRLEADGDLDETFVFIFGDHGNGLPRYKRWLTDSGLRVPLVIHIPEKFRSLAPHEPGSRTARLVSFVDFPATALSLAGVPQPDVLQGVPFLGTDVGPPREYVFGARDRADDMFEVSRSVSDGRFIYIRHFMPHLPYIQNSVIFDDRKASLRELRRLHDAGELTGGALAMFAPEKPREELYDLKNDPHELTNLAGDEEFEERRVVMRRVLMNWIVEHRDSGFMPEAMYQLRAGQCGLTPWGVIRDEKLFHLRAALRVANLVGDERTTPETLATALDADEAAARYWALIALQAKDELSEDVFDAVQTHLQDRDAVVRVEAAALLLMHDVHTEAAVSVLEAELRSARPPQALHAARACALLGPKAKPLVRRMQAVLRSLLAPPGSTRTYRDFNYASFTGWALETALKNCDAEIPTPDAK